ncbi:YcaO-like family protein [Micromonospora sp. M12]
MTDTTESIAFRSGTYRTATVEQTWERIGGMLDRFRITRVADITRLDEIGLPVHVAYRPVGATMAVSVGTGATTTQARVSAVMESIESWHAENLRPGTVVRSPAERSTCRTTSGGCTWRNGHPDPCRRTRLGGRPWAGDRCALPGAPRHHRTRLHRPARLGPRPVHPSSNGLATGNTFAEASLHALLEVVERDCIAPYCTSPLADRTYADPGTATNAMTRTVHEALLRAGCWVEVCDITNAVDVPCYAASIWSPDLPVTFGGFGCHVDPEIAVGRAMSEAAQSRLVMVSGARDDIDATAYHDVSAPPVPPPPSTGRSDRSAGIRHPGRRDPGAARTGVAGAAGHRRRAVQRRPDARRHRHPGEQGVRPRPADVRRAGPEYPTGSAP